MNIKITSNKIKYASKCFKDIKVGDYFDHNDNLWIKIDDSDKVSFNATKLFNGDKWTFNVNEIVYCVNSVTITYKVTEA